MYGLIGAAIGAMSQNWNTNAAISANKQEQQSNRDYNLNLAKMQNQWNREQWEREAQYNSPAAYRARLEAAGMNSDLAYGNVNGIAPASPGMTSGEASQPVDYSIIAGKKTLGQVVSETLQNEQAQANIALTQAQTDKTNEEAGKTASETKGIDIDNLTREEGNKLVIQMNKGVIELNDSVKQLNQQNKKVLAQTLENLKLQSNNLAEQWQVLRETWANLKVDRLGKMIDLKFRESRNVAELKQIASMTNLNYTQASTMTKRLMLDMALGKTQMNLMTQQAITEAQKRVNMRTEDWMNRGNLRGIYLQNGQLSFNLSQSVKWDDTIKSIDWCEKFCRSIFLLTSSFKGAASGSLPVSGGNPFYPQGTNW